MQPLECVAFMLIKDNHVLAEKRKLTKEVDPGVIALPGGHIENGESPKDALYREAHEELGIVPCNIEHVCTLLHAAQELQRIHYFSIKRWKGAIENHEAECLLWIPITASHGFEIGVDRIALSMYVRSDQAGSPCSPRFEESRNKIEGTRW